MFSNTIVEIHWSSDWNTCSSQQEKTTELISLLSQWHGSCKHVYLHEVDCISQTVFLKIHCFLRGGTQACMVEEAGIFQFCRRYMLGNYFSLLFIYTESAKNGQSQKWRTGKEMQESSIQSHPPALKQESLGRWLSYRFLKTCQLQGFQSFHR